MLAGARFCFVLSLFLTFVIAVTLPVPAQVNGVPPSVTSLGFGGRFINGAPASTITLGPLGYGYRDSGNWSVFGNCCANFFLPANPAPSLFSGHHRSHKKKVDASLVGVIEPVYVPYAVTDAEGDDDDSGKDLAAGPPASTPMTRGSVDRDSGGKAATAVAEDPNEEPAAVAIQPPTVLVFKDGHQFDVLNYAIVGDTLFDFADGRTRKILLADLDLPATHKVNDDRGVDFQIPAGNGQ